MLVKNYEFDTTSGMHLSLQVSDEFLSRVREHFQLAANIEPTEEQIKDYLGSSLERALVQLDC
jgi:hypothetical protein